MHLPTSELFTTEVREPRWIVKDMIPQSTLVLLAGDAGVGKSVLSLSEALHVALGRPFLGLLTSQTKVLYFDEENSRPDILAYLQQLWVGMGCPTVETLVPWFRFEHFSLSAADWPRRMVKIVQEWAPGMIYIDTATSAFAIQDENDNSEAQKIVQALRRIMGTVDPPPTIKILKHARVRSHESGVRRTIRGAKAWLGAVDQTMYHFVARGRPPAHGLKQTILVPDKSRAFGLKNNMRIYATWTEGTPKGLILKGEPFESKADLMETS